MEQWLHRGEIKVSSNFLIFIDSFVHVSPFDPFSEDTAASYCRTTTKSFKTRINDISSFINLYLYLHNIAASRCANQSGSNVCIVTVWTRNKDSSG